jgi:type I restriction enzyme S subunit
MNAERLLAHYEKIADASDAIGRLRRFILDLAVRGKLVPQDPKDEPASELMKRIAKERAKRISLGEMRHSKLSANPIDFPFEPPSGWVWLRLGDTGNIFSGNSINEPTREQLAKTQEGRPFIATKDVGYGLDRIGYENGLLVEFSDKRFKVARTNSVLICAEGGSAGKKIGLADREICFGNKLLANETWSVVSSKFSLYAYMSEFFFEQFSSKMKGIIGGISIANFLELPFPLPPHAEQHRIVAKVDELMGLCDRLEAARVGRETTRDRLAAASLARLNAPAPETFQNDARFALDALPALTTRPDQIKRLRQTILNLAVRGKLVPQDTNDEPASELLKRIVKEKGRTRHPVAAIGSEDEPYPLPKTWRWAALDQLIVSGPQNGISPKPTSREDAPKAITLTATTSGSFNPAHFKRVEARIPQDSEFWLRDGDLLFQRGNTREYVGMAAVYRGPAHAFLFPDLIMKVRVSAHMSLEFMHLASISPPAREFLSANASGAQATMPKINQTTLVSLPLPLPPLAEQHRIVAKVDALMALCDRLEASLIAIATTRRRLLDALLTEALEPAEATAA